MYRIIIADDEKLELNALKMFLTKSFGEQIELEMVSTGRSAIEMAESFHPDLMIMDIHMPGINGLDAIREIRTKHPFGTTKFIMLTAYDTFEYAQDAVGLGVAAYLTKPVHRQELLTTIRREMAHIDEEKKKRSADILLLEKIDAARPMLEAGFLSSILLRQDYDTVTSGYVQLLEIQEKEGYIMVLDFQQGDSARQNLDLAGLQGKISALTTEIFPTAILQQTGNRVFVVCPENAPQSEYAGRISVMERAEELLRRIEKLTNNPVRVGIGELTELADLGTSYQQALAALNNPDQKEKDGVYHINDLPLKKVWEEGYPQETEYAMYKACEQEDLTKVLEYAEEFFEWMEYQYSSELNDVKLKALELVMRIEYIIFHTGGRTYHFLERHGYLERVSEITDFQELKEWYMEHMRQAMRQVETSKSEQTSSQIDDAKKYILEHYSDNITLNDAAEQVHISPYYFSKVFKKETGHTFIEYLTMLRMEEAKRQLRQTDHTVKEICLNIGYSDPNYFSRSFKKYAGTTPLEYRDSHKG